MNLAMNLGTLIYRIEGELPDGEPLMSTRLSVLIVTKDGKTYEPEQASCDGEVMVINVRPVEP